MKLSGKCPIILMWEKVGEMKFIGNYSNNIDEKGRIIIPAKFRNELGGTVVISFEFEKALVVRHDNDFKKWTKSLTEMGTLNPSARKLQRAILGNSVEINIDSKGRALIPKNLLERASIKSGTQIVGVGDRVEIFSDKAWEEMNKDFDAGELEKLAEELS